MRSIAVGSRPELGEDVFQRVQRRVNRVAAGAQPEVVAGDLPAFAQCVRHCFGTESVADQVGKGLLDGIRLSGHAGQGQFRGEHAGEATHPARHVQRGGARHGVGVAGGEDEDRADPERRAHLVACSLRAAAPRPPPRPGEAPGRSGGRSAGPSSPHPIGRLLRSRRSARPACPFRTAPAIRRWPARSARPARRPGRRRSGAPRTTRSSAPPAR
jgi:hypothetical protein